MRVKKRLAASRGDRTARYKAIVESVAAGKEIDDDELARVILLVGKDLKAFEEDVERRKERVAAFNEKQEALSLAPKIRQARQDFEKVCRELEKARADYDQKTRPLVGKHDELRTSIRDMEETYRAGLTEANRYLVQTADPALHQRVEELNKKRTNLLERRPHVEADRPEAEKAEARLNRERKSFKRWKAGRDTGLSHDSDSMTRLPRWAGGDEWGEHGRLPEPTPEEIKRCEARLTQLEERTRTVAKVEAELADLDRQIAQTEAEIAETERKMLEL